MADIYTRLQWLPEASESFSADVKALLASDDGAIGDRLRKLASQALDNDQLSKLGRAIDRSRKSGRDFAPLEPFRLAVISNATTDFLMPALSATAARHGFDLECHATSYGQTMQEVLDSGSQLYAFEPDAVLLALDHRAFQSSTKLADRSAAEALVEHNVDYLAGIVKALQANCAATCIYQTIARPPETTFGSLDRALPGTQRWLNDALNRAIVERLEGSGTVLLDTAGVAETVGLANWHAPALWNMAKLQFSLDYLPLYADHVLRLVSAMKGKSAKVVGLDLDNTLWGGVIGDDGVEGIVIGQGDATGEAHLDLQRSALQLRDRGVVLAVSSKNTDEVARAPFRNHPDMLLREDHIAVFQANWEDKATNLMAISRELNVGIDSLVFVDDNPMERDLVRQLAPTVRVPEMPADPALYARTLAAGGYFEAISVTGEDFERAQAYQVAAKRAEMRSSSHNLDDYLASLEMTARIAPFDAAGRSRIAQLINKSNQFNLTTRRYSEADVHEIEESSQALGIQIRLEDIFGDNGMISVIICREADSEWFIDTWLMSCRVLGRTVEFAALNELVRVARARGIKAINGHYIPTPKNGLVSDHFDKLNFEMVSQTGEEKRYRLSVDDYAFLPTPITVDSSL